MKKNLFYCLVLICSFGFFTACSDDDDDKGLKEKTYSESQLILSVNGKTIVGETVTVNPTGTEATITLSGVLVEGKAAQVTAVLVESGDEYKLTGSLKKGFYEVDLEGKISAEGVLTMSVIYKNNTGLVGYWKYSDVHVKVIAPNGIKLSDEQPAVSAEEVTFMLYNKLIPYFSQLEQLILNQNGVVDVVTSIDPSKVESDITNYHAIGNEFYVQTNKLLGNIRRFMTKDVGPAYPSFIPFTYALEDNKMTLLLNKEQISFIVSFLEIIVSFVGDWNEEIEEYVKLLLAIHQQTTEFEVGIVFNKTQVIGNL